MSLDLTHPAVEDLCKTARRRLPRFAFEYLDSATGSEMSARRNRLGLDQVGFRAGVMAGAIDPDLSCRFMGQDVSLPLIMAPIGMAGTVWPGAEAMLARAAARHRLIYCQSNVAAARPEDTGPLLPSGLGWFQHYPVKDDTVRRDMLARVKAAGFDTLVVTVDVPAESRRERQRRAHLAMPPKLSARLVWETLRSPAWMLAMSHHGAPRMHFCEDYVEARGAEAFVHAGKLLRGYPDRSDIAHLRDIWDGPMIVKGVGEVDDAVWLVKRGIDAIWVSNHGGRQFEAGPAAIELLAPIRATLGADVPIIFDSGLRGGLDILRALALGADIVAMGRSFLYALGAFGDAGLDHLVAILRDDMISNMAQIGVHDFHALAGALVPGGVPAA
ncbi:MAG: alpha-hydroxy acid oxidase [Pseudomonadota bacterium]